MKKRLLVAAAVVLAALGVWIFSRSNASSGLVLPHAWHIGSQEQLQQIAAYGSAPESERSPKTLAACRKLLARTTEIKRSKIDFLTVWRSDDNSFHFYVFGEKDVFGPSYVFRVDSASGKILDNFLLPDA